MKRISLFFVVILFLGINHLQAQSEKTIRGTVLDQDTNTPLPFATILIPNTLNGTVTNENGEFEINILKENLELQVSYIGYLDKMVTVKSLEKDKLIYLSAWETELETVLVRPQTPEYYIKAAVNNYKNTINHNPFETRAYFKEKTIESNGKESSIEYDEAVFSTYYADYSNDTLKNNSRLVLYRNRDEKTDVKYAFEERLEKKADKWDARADKKDERKEARAKRKGEVEEPKKTEEEKTQEINIGDISDDAGPDKILKEVQNISGFDFLDSTNFKKIEFAFGKPSHYNNRKLMTIHFNTKRKVNDSNYKGTIYLDHNSLAFVAFDYTENLKIPFLINALIKTLLGIKIENISKKVEIRNQIFEEYWYPKDIRFDIDFGISQGGIFIENETAIFKLQQVLNIDNINTENVETIDSDNVFDGEKEYKDQIHNLENLKWSDVNVIKD